MQPFPQVLKHQQDTLEMYSAHRAIIANATTLLKEMATMAQDIELEVRTVLIEVFQCTDEQIAPKSRLRRELGLDEYEIFDFAEELEERLGIPVDVQHITGAQTVQEVVDLLTKNLSREAEA